MKRTRSKKSRDTVPLIYLQMRDGVPAHMRSKYPVQCFPLYSIILAMGNPTYVNKTKKLDKTKLIGVTQLQCVSLLALFKKGGEKRQKMIDLQN
jgi:hypothetical protein